MSEAAPNSVSWPEPEGWPHDATRDRLIGDWYLYQRKGGHRTSTDDLITAWYATHRNPNPPATYLDLGCGIGSVMLMVSHRLRPAAVWGVEAQAQSFSMARRTVAELPDHNCEFFLRHSDFRNVDFEGRTFNLITGSPPYFPLGTGVLPEDAQRRAYLATAARALSAQGRFYLVFQTAWTDRVHASGKASGLHLTGQADFLMRSDREQPFLSVYEFSLVPDSGIHRFSCPVRNECGEISKSYQKIREELGL